MKIWTIRFFSVPSNYHYWLKMKTTVPNWLETIKNVPLSPYHLLPFPGSQSLHQPYHAITETYSKEVTTRPLGPVEDFPKDIVNILRETNNQSPPLIRRYEKGKVVLENESRSEKNRKIYNKRMKQKIHQNLSGFSSFTVLWDPDRSEFLSEKQYFAKPVEQKIYWFAIHSSKEHLCAWKSSSISISMFQSINPSIRLLERKLRNEQNLQKFTFSGAYPVSGTITIFWNDWENQKWWYLKK